MAGRVERIAPLLFGSGLCSLVYQTVWLREFRLIFGASTAASAAVLAIFMGGLGLGGALLGARADRHERPLTFYANLELLVAATAAVSPFLVMLARAAYVGMGGTPNLGMGLGTVVRLVLSALVLAAPTVLMGGTLPAAARAVGSDADPQRRHLAILYGVNTLGAVTGAALATFALLEIFGNRTTLWLACLVNALVAVIARSVSRTLGPADAATPAPASTTAVAPLPSRGFVLVAAAVTGFAFLLMELVWYRMLGPLLGGTTFTFGLILALALLGMGLGGAAYAWGFRHRSATLSGFALTCAAEAALIALPFALGDRLAVIAALLRPLGGMGFGGMVLGWTLVTAVVVLPAAFVAGVQFPLLLALMGRGGHEVGQQVGRVYAWNTAGAIVGSLGGGFGILPLITAPVTWQLVAGILTALGLGSSLLAFRTDRARGALLMPLATGVLTVMLLSAQGPTAAWRHGGVGAGRSGLHEPHLNEIQAWLRYNARGTVWEREGVESSVALDGSNGLSFIINGKADGNSIGDAPTQVMSGLLGALLHPDPRAALVIGLGTGSTAGWLGAVPSIERVDAVEIEPAILDVARQCHDVNHAVMDDPKVHVSIADAREVLLTSRQRYDIIFSEPSNPYRAGISSLFTRDFYRVVKERLAEGGYFLQWLQAYEVDALTVQSVYATLSSEFESVETWQLHHGDLLLVATRKPVTHDVARLRARLAEEPYLTATRSIWRTDEVEGVLAHFIASPEFTRHVAEDNASLTNTDDLSSMEFALARSLGRETGFSAGSLWEASRRLGTDRPGLAGGEADWGRVEQLRLWNDVPAPGGEAAEASALRLREAFVRAVETRDFARARQLWIQGGWAPHGPREQVAVAQALAASGDEQAMPFIATLRATLPVEADLLEGLLRIRQHRAEDAAALLERAFTGLHATPWPPRELTSLLLDAVPSIARQDRVLGRRLYEVLRKPFAAASLSQAREDTRLALARVVDWPGLCVDALSAMEPHVPWDAETLEGRRQCYTAASHPLATRAAQELEEFVAQAPMPFLGGEFSPPAPPARSDVAGTPVR
ncbi:fused MFS/spermidine synthase [Myxococcaceae bacterium JPH2]|nr:fused MFS/spermidine synthase [Myxococcaceae bacterium JPH2]